MAKGRSWFGRETEDPRKAFMIARVIAGQIGATMTARRGSNKCTYKGRPAVIKTLKSRTNSAWVTPKMHKQVEQILGALQDDGGQYDVYSLERSDWPKKDPRGWIRIMRETFKERGTLVARGVEVTLELLETESLLD